MQRVSLICEREISALALRGPGVLECVDGLESGYIRVRITVCDLQRYAQEHAEEEEHCHAFALEKFESVKSQGFHQGAAFRCFRSGAFGHCESVQCEEYAESRRYEKLHVCGLEMRVCRSGEVYEQHGADETYRAPYADGRKVLNGIHAGFGEGIERH